MWWLISECGAERGKENKTAKGKSYIDESILQGLHKCLMEQVFKNPPQEKWEKYTDTGASPGQQKIAPRNVNSPAFLDSILVALTQFLLLSSSIMSQNRNQEKQVMVNLYKAQSWQAVL